MRPEDSWGVSAVCESGFVYDVLIMSKALSVLVMGRRISLDYGTERKSKSRDGE